MTMRAPSPLRGFDEDLRMRLGAALAHDGVVMKYETLPTRIDRVEGGLSVALTNGTSLEVDEVLVATGRRPNTAGLGLEAVGVRLAEHGGVVVDEQGTSNVRSIHAVGDVSSRLQLTPVAIREGHALADRLFGSGARPVNLDLVSIAVFTTPEIGTVGLTEDAALRRYPEVDIYQSDFRPMRATLSGSADRTFMKLVVDAASGKVVGAHLLGENSGEIVQTLAIAMTMGATKADLDATIALHPSAAEELVTMRTPYARRRRAAA